MNTSEEREFRLRDLGGVINRYKYVILLITLLSFIIAYIYAYYIQNIYQASSTVLIEKEDKQSFKPNDIVENALNISTSSNLNTEIEIIKSRFLVQKVIEKLHLNKEYMALNSFGKKYFYYKDFPFDVDINSTQNLYIKIIPKNKNKFTLEVKGVKNSKKEKDYLYGKHIKNQYYDIVVNKKPNSTLTMKEYHAIFYKPSYLARIISNERLNVEILGEDTSILKISYTDTVSKRAQDFVNFLTKIYMEQNLKNKTKEVVFTLEFINKQLNKIKKNLNLSSKKLETFKIKSNTIDIKDSIKKLSAQLTEYENQKNILSLKVDTLKKIVKQIKKGTNLDTITLSGINIENNTINDLVSQLQNALIKKRFLLKDYTYTNSKVKKVQTQIIQLKDMIKKTVINLLNNIEYQRRVLDKKILTLNNKLKMLSINEQNYVTLEKNFLLNSKFYSYLLQKKTEAEIKKAATINKNRILDYAVLPDSYIKPKRKKLYIIGISFGFILGIIISFILYLLNKKINVIEDIENTIGANKIAGAISELKGAKNGLSIEKLDKKIFNQFRNLRTNLSLLLDFNKGGIISINSTVNSEGKSFISAFLAQSISLLDKKVLIIDNSINNPSIHTIFKIENREGLSDYLQSNELDIATYIKHRDNISILPAGKNLKNASELISSKKYEELLNNLKNLYDFIIIDTPSFSHSSEIKNIFRFSDTILYIYRVKFSKKEYINIAKELSKNNENTAIVVNFISNIENSYKHNLFNIDKIKSK